MFAVPPKRRAAAAARPPAAEDSACPSPSAPWQLCGIVERSDSAQMRASTYKMLPWMRWRMSAFGPKRTKLDFGRGRLVR